MPITNIPETLPMPAAEKAMLPLVDVPGGLKLVLGAVPKGVEVAPHKTPYPASVQLLEGSLEVLKGETWTRITPGERVPFEQGQLHALRALESSYILVTHLRHLGK